MLTESELEQRARTIQLVAVDCEAVLTDALDGGPILGLKPFSLKDGMAVPRLRAVGIRTAILARERSPMLAQRAEKLGLSQVYLGVDDRSAHLDMIMSDAGISPAAVAYMGASIADLELMSTIAAAGLVAVPGDAPEEVAAFAHYRCQRKSGLGAFGELAEVLLRLR